MSTQFPPTNPSDDLGTTGVGGETAVGCGHRSRISKRHDAAPQNTRENVEGNREEGRAESGLRGALREAVHNIDECILVQSGFLVGYGFSLGCIFLVSSKAPELAGIDGYIASPGRTAYTEVYNPPDIDRTGTRNQQPRESDPPATSVRQDTDRANRVLLTR